MASNIIYEFMGFHKTYKVLGTPAKVFLYPVCVNPDFPGSSITIKYALDELGAIKFPPHINSNKLNSIDWIQEIKDEMEKKIYVLDGKESIRLKTHNIVLNYYEQKHPGPHTRIARKAIRDALPRYNRFDPMQNGQFGRNGFFNPPKDGSEYNKNEDLKEGLIRLAKEGGASDREMAFLASLRKVGEEGNGEMTQMGETSGGTGSVGGGVGGNTGVKSGRQHGGFTGAEASGNGGGLRKSRDGGVGGIVQIEAGGGGGVGGKERIGGMAAEESSGFGVGAKYGKKRDEEVVGEDESTDDDSGGDGEDISQ